jgi:hypothetical protein
MAINWRVSSSNSAIFVEGMQPLSTSNSSVSVSATASMQEAEDLAGWEAWNEAHVVIDITQHRKGRKSWRPMSAAAGRSGNLPRGPGSDIRR